MGDSRMALRAASRAVIGVLYVVAASQAATLLRYPYLQNVRSDRATLLWTTAETGLAVVQYSTDRSFSNSITASTRRFGTTETGLSAAYFQHQADLTGLISGTDYFYRVVVDDQNLTPGDELRFRTPGSGPFSFLVFGDSGAGTPAQRQLAQLMLQERPALILHAGDLAYGSGTFEQFQINHFNYYRDLMKRAPFFPTPGNHEYVTGAAAPYLAVHSLPAEDVPFPDQGRYYSFDWGNVHFVSLDSNTPLLDAVNRGGGMLQWLESDLQKSRQTWKVVYFHHTAYPILQHELDPNSEVVRARIVPIMDKYSVDLVFSGHEHIYQQTRPLRGNEAVQPGFGTVYITTGGGGAPLHPAVPRPWQVFAESFHHYVRAEVQGAVMTLRAIGLDGQEKDSLTLFPQVPQGGDPARVSREAVVNAASFTPSLAPGMLVSIFGRNLAVREAVLPGLPAPTELSYTSVTINGSRLPLLFVSPTQINAQLPFQVLGSASLVVTTPYGSTELPVVVSDAAPGIFSASPEPAVVHANGGLVSLAAPARSGETLSIYLTGLGEVNGEITAGAAAPASPLLAVRASVQVQLGGLTVTPAFAGLAPGFIGLYQVNFQVPSGLPSGTQTMRVVTRGISSNPVALAVR